MEKEWKKQWKGKTFFSHGANHSRGVLILAKVQVDFKLQSLKVDLQGRYVLLEAVIVDSPFALLNIYAPNKCAERCNFFHKISEELKSSFTLVDSSFIIGGDFDMIFDQDVDGSGGIKEMKESVKTLKDICLEQDLIDVWRLRNLTEKHFTWRQKPNYSGTFRLYRQVLQLRKWTIVLKQFPVYMIIVNIINLLR